MALLSLYDNGPSVLRNPPKSPESSFLVTKDSMGLRKVSESSGSLPQPLGGSLPQQRPALSCCSTKPKPGPGFTFCLRFRSGGEG